MSGSKPQSGGRANGASWPVGRDAKGRWKPNQSGNPNGRPIKPEPKIPTTLREMVADVAVVKQENGARAIDAIARAIVKDLIVASPRDRAVLLRTLHALRFLDFIEVGVAQAAQAQRDERERCGREAEAFEPKAAKPDEEALRVKRAYLESEQGIADQIKALDLMRRDLIAKLEQRKAEQADEKGKSRRRPRSGGRGPAERGSDPG